MTSEIEQRLLDGLMPDQVDAVRSKKRRVLVVAGAGSGKTEVMARRIAWWVGVLGVPKDNIVAFTFTEKAAEEIKFRVRSWIGNVTPKGEDINLGGMYVGTIHGYCLAKIREYWSDEYHNYDVLDEAARDALILRGFNGVLGLRGLQAKLEKSQSETVDRFIMGYDQLHEHNRFDIKLAEGHPPYQLGEAESEWCKSAHLVTDVGDDDISSNFSVSAARYYAYLRCRRFLDFSTSQTEFLRKLRSDSALLAALAEQQIHLVVDEVQDINPVQRDLIELIVGKDGRLTAVGDHRQSIYGFRGSKVELIGEMWKEFNGASDADVLDLKHNFRSTPRIIDIANRWAATITPAGSMKTAPMVHGRKRRIDIDPSHVALTHFDNRDEEALWIANAIRAIVPSATQGAKHDHGKDHVRGLALSDIAVLVRSSTDVRTYMRALEAAQIPSIVRAGPDLFSQPEVLLLISALAVSAGIEEFFGAPHNTKSLPSRIANVLGCQPEPRMVFYAATRILATTGIGIGEAAEARLLKAAICLKTRIVDQTPLSNSDVTQFLTNGMREFLTRKGKLRRVFPQQIFHWLLAEAQVEQWDQCVGRGETAMFHLGALSSLITSLETPGWTSASDYKWQIIGLCQYGSEGGRAPEQPLIVQPDAVTISTIHGVKGLEFSAVFLADVNARRFPSNYAKRRVNVPMAGAIVDEIDIAGLSDNDNYDGERRLMYVALTRAERFLVVSHSGTSRSKFIKQLESMISESGGTVSDNPTDLLNKIQHTQLEYDREIQLSTSFSDLRYYLACPHDFYLRKVLGFAPTIDQAFGYGRGVHNLMRAIHSNPVHWAELARDRPRLEAAIQNLIDHGLFYLRYTTGEPAENMRKKGVRIAADYVERFAAELSELTFEPEKEFETLVEYDDAEGGALVSGSIDIVRRDDPPRVTLIDFKSGDPQLGNHQKLDEDEMRLQIGIYAVAAQRELEYEPERGLVRYLGGDDPENSELKVPLDATSIANAKQAVVDTATAIRDRKFFSDPKKQGGDGRLRCGTCDFLGICGMKAAINYKAKI